MGHSVIKIRPLLSLKKALRLGTGIFFD